MINSLKNISTRFARDEDGIALTEYLILLGLLTGAVIAAVILFGGNLAASWNAWAGWVDDANLGPDPINTGTTSGTTTGTTSGTTTGTTSGTTTGTTTGG